MNLLPDWREFIELLNSHGVEYVIVGWARAFHGIPRSAGDIDFFSGLRRCNAERLLGVIAQFGFGSLDITQENFQAPDRVIQLGVEPYRIDQVPAFPG